MEEKKRESEIELVSTGENIVDKVKPEKIDELLIHIQKSIDDLKSRMDDIDTESFYQYSSINDWYNELSRCNKVLAKKSGDKKSYDYKGESDIVTNDFHKAILINENTFKKMFHNLHTKFGAITDNEQKTVETELAKELVKHSMNLTKLNSKVSKFTGPLSNFGNTIIYTPMRVIDKNVDELTNLVLKDGKPFLDPATGGFKRSKEYRWEKVEKKVVYTDFIPFDIRDFIYDPTIELVEDQEELFQKMSLVPSEMRKLEEDGLLSGVREYLDTLEDDSRIWEDSPTKVDGTLVNVAPRVVTKCYIEIEDLLDKSGEFKRYEIVQGNSKTILSIIETDELPFINAQYWKSDDFPFLGMGVGQAIYSSYIYLNIRWNQGYDKRTTELIPGGLIDSILQIKDGDRMGPNKWVEVNGLRNMQGNPMRPWTSMMGGFTSQSDQKDLTQLKEAIQTEVPTVLGGVPTGTLADRAAKTLQLLSSNATSLMGVDFIEIESRIFSTYAKKAYNNYIKFLKNETTNPAEIRSILLDWFGKDKLTFEGPITEENKEGKYELDFPTVFPEVNFVFTGAKESIDEANQIAKIQEVVSTLGNMGQIMPEKVMQQLESFDLNAFVKKMFVLLELPDVDILFPSYNPEKENIDLKGTLAEQKQRMAKVEKMAMILLQIVQETGDSALINKVTQAYEGLVNQENSKNQ